MIITAPASLESLEPLLCSPSDGLLIGVDGLSVRCSALCQVDKLNDWIERIHFAGKKVFVNAMAMMEESSLERMQDLFEQVLKSDVDGIYIADEGLIQIALESAPTCVSKLIYQPETLICSGQDASFYTGLGLQAASLSHELSVEEMKECARICPDLEILISGHYSWMESRRPLVENYLRHIGKEEEFAEGKIYSIREMQRENQLKIWQDQWGSHVLSDTPIQAGSVLKELEQAGIHRFRIDCIGMDNAWGARMSALYSDLLQGIPSPVPPTEFRMEESLIRKEKSNVH